MSEWNQAIAAAAEWLKDQIRYYPADIFRPTSDSPDAIAGSALRDMLPRFARRMQDELSREEED